MKIKTKLRLGFGFLFLVLIGFGAISLFYVNKISNNAKVILKDNYKSLKYVRDMRSVIDEDPALLKEDSKNSFGAQLRLEGNNITEKGENAAVDKIKASYQVLMASIPPDKYKRQQALAEIRSSLKEIEVINMDAIVRKNAVAQRSVEKATLYLGTAASVCFLVLFSFIINFPGFIANPLKELLDGIQEIGNKNYKQRLEVRGSDEFSQLALAFNQMARKLDEWENSNIAKLKSEKLRIETIIEQMDDGIFGINEVGELLFINNLAEQLLNVNRLKVQGENISVISKNNDLLRTILEQERTDKLIKIYTGGKESYFQLESRNIDIPHFQEEEEAVVTALKYVGKVFILRNITNFKERDEAKTNFIATVSHELKTPISSIKMSLKLLNDNRIGELNAEQKEMLNHIEEDNNRLLKITGELLDLSQVETGNIQLNFIPADPAEIARYALDAVKFQAEQKGIELELLSNENMQKVSADFEKTAWVLVNFLSNALRYSSEKSKIILRVMEKDKEVEFSVQDFGKGIDEQYCKRLFDRYFQVPTDGQNKSGSGLGLAISKDFIEAQNGRIWVESEIGVGSTFSFSLPALGR